MTTAASLPGGEDERTGGASFIADGGEAGTLIRSIDWRSTHLGPAGQWPQSLRTSVSLCVSSRFPIALYWGREFVMLYNDALLPMVGANKHPWRWGARRSRSCPRSATSSAPCSSASSTRAKPSGPRT